MSTLVNPTRHSQIFDPSHLRGRELHIAGVGTTGSRIAEGFACLGIDPLQMHIYDFDTVESVNIAPQRYDQDDIGRSKVEAIADRIQRKTRTCPHTHERRLTSKHKLSGYVFLCLDDLDERNAIWQGAIKSNEDVIMMFDVGIGIANGKYFGVRPCNEVHIEKYEAHRAMDREAQRLTEAHMRRTNICVTEQNIGYTADILCGIVGWQFVKWISCENGSPEPFQNVIAFSMKGEATPANEIWG